MTRRFFLLDTVSGLPVNGNKVEVIQYLKSATLRYIILFENQEKYSNYVQFICDIYCRRSCRVVTRGIRATVKRSVRSGPDRHPRLNVTFPLPPTNPTNQTKLSVRQLFNASINSSVSSTIKKGFKCIHS